MRTDNPNYGPGSISTKAKAKVAALKAHEAKEKMPMKPVGGPVGGASSGSGMSLLNAITKGTGGPMRSGGPMSSSAKAIQDRDEQQKQLKKEVGGRK
jgi:hypothetical protein